MTADRVVIVGAGPAGAATALGLARAGIAVTLLERAAFPRRKVCGEYLGAGAVAALQRLGLLETLRSEGRSLQGIRLAVAGVARVELRFESPAVAIARELLDSALANAAARAGAVVERARVEDLVRDPEGRVCGVTARDESGTVRELRGRFVVGADGTGSIVARKLGFTRTRNADQRFAIGGHYRDANAANGLIEMFVDARSYLAINPLAGGISNVMAVVRKADVEYWTRLLELSATSRSGPRVAIGPLEHRVRRRVAPGVALVGDAAGFLNPFTGQGVYLALRGAERLVRALCAAYADSQAEQAQLEVYDSATRRELRARARLASTIDLLVRVPFLARRAAPRLERSPQLAKILLDALMGASEPHTALRPAVLRRLLV